MQSAPVAARASGPEVLGVLLTSKCNVTCRHCCNDSHPRQSDVVRFEEIARLVDVARDVPSLREVGISGGEPFLFASLLLSVVQYAAHAGFTSSVTTNGFWGRAPDRASPLLAQLRAAGLRTVHISTSVFHQEFIELATVASAAKSARQAGLRVTINVVSTASLSRSEIENGLGELSNEVEFVVMPCLPAGRGMTDVHQSEFGPGFVSPPGNCREHFKKLAVDTRGDVYPCCSPGGFTPPLRLGNVKDTALASIVEESASNRLLAILESVGPRFFLPFLRAAGVEPPVPATFTDQCHLCHVILSTDAYASTIRGASEQLFTELTALDPLERPAAGDSRLAQALDHVTGG